MPLGDPNIPQSVSLVEIDPSRMGLPQDWGTQILRAVKTYASLKAENAAHPLTHEGPTVNEDRPLPTVVVEKSEHLFNKLDWLADYYRGPQAELISGHFGIELVPIPLTAEDIIRLGVDPAAAVPTIGEMVNEALSATVIGLHGRMVAHTDFWPFGVNVYAKRSRKLGGGLLVVGDPGDEAYDEITTDPRQIVEPREGALSLVHLDEFPHVVTPVGHEDFTSDDAKAAPFEDSPDIGDEKWWSHARVSLNSNYAPVEFVRSYLLGGTGGTLVEHINTRRDR